MMVLDLSGALSLTLSMEGSLERQRMTLAGTPTVVRKSRHMTLSGLSKSLKMVAVSHVPRGLDLQIIGDCERYEI